MANLIIGIANSTSSNSILGPSYDPSAQAFITAAGITDDVQKDAINTLVVDLKSANLWNKPYAIYPIVGGTSSSHAVNLKTPGTFNLTFSTGWTHSSTGMTPNGSAYANTGLTPSITLALNNVNLSYYSRTNTNSGYDVGCSYQSGVTQYCLMIIRDGNIFYNAINSQQGNYATVSNTNSQGFFIANRTASNVTSGFKNSTRIVSGTNASNLRPDKPLYLAATNNNGTAGFYTTRECAFASIGQGFTDAESVSYYNIVQAFQTTLERSV